MPSRFSGLSVTGELLRHSQLIMTSLRAYVRHRSLGRYCVLRRIPILRHHSGRARICVSRRMPWAILWRHGSSAMCCMWRKISSVVVWRKSNLTSRWMMRRVSYVSIWRHSWIWRRINIASLWRHGIFCPVLRMLEGILHQYVTSQQCLVVVRMGEHIVNQPMDWGKILNTD